MWEVKEFNPIEYSESTWAPAELKAKIVLENMAYGVCKNEKYRLGSGLLVAKKVIFNPPATIVIWEDGTKTIVKCMEGDTYDAEKGLALCYMKKACEYYGFSYQKELKQAKDWTKSVIPSEVLEGDFIKRMFDIVEKHETELRNHETRTSTD